MSSKKETLDFVLSQMEDIDGIKTRCMMAKSV